MTKIQTPRPVICRRIGKVIYVAEWPAPRQPVSISPSRYLSASSLNETGRLSEIERLARHKQAYNEAKETEDGAEDLNDKNLDEPGFEQQLALVHPLSSASTYKLGSAASANAALLPLIPTDTPHIKLQAPTISPLQNIA